MSETRDVRPLIERLRKEATDWRHGRYSQIAFTETADALAALSIAGGGQPVSVTYRLRWHGIESAPKDGTEVDLWGSHIGSTPARIPDCSFLAKADIPGWYTRGDNGWECLADIGWKPTHWTPLPPAPVQPDAREGAEG